MAKLFVVFAVLALAAIGAGKLKKKKKNKLTLSTRIKPAFSYSLESVNCRHNSQFAFVQRKLSVN